MQLLQGSSELWLPKQKPQQVPLRLPAQLLQVPIVPSPQLFLQQHSCKFWLYPAHGLPLDSPIPSVPQGMVLDSAKLAESGALLQRYWTETLKHWQFLENCWLSPSNPVHLVILQEVTLSMSTKSEQVLVKAPKKDWKCGRVLEGVCAQQQALQAVWAALFGSTKVYLCFPRAK